MGNISGSTLNDDSPKGVNGTITGAVSGTETGDDFLDFSTSTDRVNLPNGAMANSPSFEGVFVIKNEDGSNGGLFDYDWDILATKVSGDVILLNEPSSSRVRMLYRPSDPGAPVTIVTTSALSVGVKTVIFFGVSFTGMFLEHGGERVTAVISHSGVPSGTSKCTFGNRGLENATAGGKIYDFAMFNRTLTTAERLEWEASI
jgi:hypothetical protein